MSDFVRSRWRRVVVWVGLVVAAGGLVAVAAIVVFQGSTTSRTGAPLGARIKVIADCSTPSFEPSLIEVTCADGGLGFRDLRWSSWSATQAQAVGTMWYKDCIPDCATGHVIDVANDRVTLGAPVTVAGGHRLWSQISFDPEPPGYATGPYHRGPVPLPLQPV